VAQFRLSPALLWAATSARQTAMIRVDARNRRLLISCGNDFIKERPIKGPHGAIMDFQSYFSLIMSFGRE
jgi:hypothetical protein